VSVYCDSNIPLGTGIKVDRLNICLFSALSQGPPLMMIQELVPLGSMLAYLIEFPDRVIPNRDLKIWASQIACGKKYLTFSSL